MNNPIDSAKKIIDEACSLLSQNKCSSNPTVKSQSLLEHQANALINNFGIKTAELKLASNINNVLQAAQTIGYPVTLKIVSHDILHKSDVGGVKVGIKDEESLNFEYNTMIDKIKSNIPEAEIIGVLVEKTVPTSTEVIIGALRDPQFGPAVMFGLGGIFVEIIKDVSFRLAPVNKNEALEMIHEIKAYPLLKGFRGLPPLDVNAIAETILAVSTIITNINSVKEIDINPAMVYEKGIVAVDARVILQ